ncbi:MFS general substrate transporter [Amylostereum chailletii]|nr:MFS general substrate transporter [Amylostereum chailletii]
MPSTIHVPPRASFEQDVGETPTADIEASVSFEPRGYSTDSKDQSESAVDTTATDYNMPSFLSAPSSRVRRRSELAFSRPQKPVQDDTLSAYEMPPVAPHVSARVRALPPDVPEEEIEIEKGKIELPETAVSSAMPTPAPSLYYSDGVALTSAVNHRTSSQRRLGMLHFLALCFNFFLEGWNDGTTGPMLPTFQERYNLGFIVVSMVFVLNMVGFVLGAFVLVPLTEKYGFGKVTSLYHVFRCVNFAVPPSLPPLIGLFPGASFQLAAYSMLASGGPFPLIVIAYGLAGFGMSLQNSLANAFVGNLKSGTAAKLCLLHGSYGFGAFAAPLVATQFANQEHWSYHYFTSLGIAVANTAILSALFRFRTQDEIMLEAGEEAAEPAAQGGSSLRNILGIRSIHIMAAFVLIYVGVEVTLGGWIVTFIIRERHGGPTSGYISSGFFGGMTVGRVGLIRLNSFIGESNALTVYAIISIVLEITVWAVPSLIENAVAVSMIGVLIGPMYPIVVNHATKIFPKWILGGALGIISGFGQTGSAFLPFITGVLAAKFGIGSLQPLVVSMMAFMTVLWWIVPKTPRRTD